MPHASAKVKNHRRKASSLHAFRSTPDSNSQWICVIPVRFLPSPLSPRPGDQETRASGARSKKVGKFEAGQGGAGGYGLAYWPMNRIMSFPQQQIKTRMDDRRQRLEQKETCESQQRWLGPSSRLASLEKSCFILLGVSAKFQGRAGESFPSRESSQAVGSVFIFPNHKKSQKSQNGGSVESSFHTFCGHCPF